MEIEVEINEMVAPSLSSERIMEIKIEINEMVAPSLSCERIMEINEMVAP